VGSCRTLSHFGGTGELATAVFFSYFPKKSMFGKKKGGGTARSRTPVTSGTVPEVTMVQGVERAITS
jgi:hypothetical protein